jgi:hypothetical protein
VQPWEGNHLPKLLRVANIDFALELVSSTEISVHPFLDQHRLDGGVAKDDSCGQETIHDGEADLNYNEFTYAFVSIVVPRMRLP